MSATGLWHSRSFVALFSAQVISLLGSGVTTIGLSLFVYQLAGASAATVVIGQALMLRILAFLLFSQPAGILADRFNRKYILITADLARFALLSLFPFLTQTWHIYILIFAINAVTAFFTPTFEATLPEIVGEKHYVQALSLSRVASDVEAIASPALAGLLVALLGVKWVFWFDAFTYLVSAALVAVATIPLPKRSQAPLSWRAFPAEITLGTRVLLREPALRQALLMSLAEATAGAAAIVSTVQYVRLVLGKSEIVFGLVMAGVGIGSSITALVLGRLSKRLERGSVNPAELHLRRHRWTAFALLLGGIFAAASLFPGVLVPPLWFFVLLWIANGVGQGLIAISSGTLLAEHTIEAERGRAYAAHFALTHACWLITYPATGYAAARWGSPMAFTLAGGVCLLTTVVAFHRGVATPQLHGAK